MKDIINTAKQQVEYYRLLNDSPVLLDDRLIFYNSSQMINHEYLHYPFMDHIYIHHDLSREGIYERIYWLDGMWKQAESTVWKHRKEICGISEESRGCKFYTTHYRKNTLLNPDKFYIEENILYICRDQLVGDRKQMVWDKIKEFRPEWLQMEAAEALLLLEEDEGRLALDGLQIKYIEILNSLRTDLCAALQQRFGCPVRRSYRSSLFGWIAFENEKSEMELLTENISVHYEKEMPLFSTRINEVMPVFFYRTGYFLSAKADTWIITQEETSGSPLITLDHGSRICGDLFKRPIEFMNERVGRILNQVQITQERAGQFIIHIGMNSSYWGWRDEVKKLFLENLFIPELVRAEYKFFFEKDMLKDKRPFFINAAEI